MSKQSVLVTYAAPQSFQLSDNWKQVHAALLSQLPLRNVHWSSASRPSARTIQELTVTLTPWDTLRDERASQIPVTILEKPLLNLFFVACEDIETYRGTLKKQIKDWISTVSQRKNQDWLIVHIVRPDARAVAGSFFQMKGSVLDKIKGDFNTDKRDRCVQLAWTFGQDNSAAWGDVIAKVKDSLLHAFDSAVVQREDEVKRSESQRQMPGWNFCTFFILKESLASSFQGVNLFEDALLQYDELEASFFQVLREKNLSWFGNLISAAPNDDSAPLLSISKKPYRDLILANTISVFDFRIYLLSRQCALLAKIGRINEVARKVSAFLGAFGRRLRDVEVPIPAFFVESWTYSSALSVVEQCDVWASTLNIETSALASFNAGKGELLELARNQLDAIGVKVGHLPIQSPFSQSWSSSYASSWKNADAPKISQPDLISSLDDSEAFYHLYIAVTDRAIDMYAKAGRRKFALKLHGSLAALDVHRGRLDAALQTYTSLPAHYAPHMWTSLEYQMLSRALDIHARLAKPNDKEWICVVLCFLKTYMESRGQELLIEESHKLEYISQLVNRLRAAAGELTADLVQSDHPALSIQVESNARIAESEDGSFLDLTIRNHLPCDIPADEISVVLAGCDMERLKFVSKTGPLAPGTTPMTLFCSTSSSGTFILDSSEIRISHLHLLWNHRKSQGAGSNRANANTILVVIPRDPVAVDIRLCQPNSIELGASPRILASVYTGRNQISRATIKLSAPSGFLFRYLEAVLSTEGAAHLEVAEDAIVLTDIPKDRSVGILIPHSDTSAFHHLSVNMNVEYVTKSEPSMTRNLRLTRVVPISLPVAVSVQDFFRGTRLFSKFTISTTSHQHVRISSAKLDCPEGVSLEGVKIVGCVPRKQDVITVTPAEPANFLFYVDSAHGPVHESLTLLIKYRMLREEVESRIKDAVEIVITKSPSWLPHRTILINKLVGALEVDAEWVNMYRITGELVVPGLHDQAGEIGIALSQVKTVLRTNKYSIALPGKWREILIPVDVPHMSIVAAARVQIFSSLATDATPKKKPPLYAGQPISAVLSVTTSFHWRASEAENGCNYMMRFDIEEMTREWLVSGRKRGNFAAKDGGTFSLPITLIALHHGYLPLPKVAVSPLHITGSEVAMGSMAVPSTETYQVHGAEKVLVLPRSARTTFAVDMGNG